MSIYAPFCAPEHRSAQAMDQHRRHDMAHGAMAASCTLAADDACDPEYAEWTRGAIVRAADTLIAMGAPL